MFLSRRCCASILYRLSTTRSTVTAAIVTISWGPMATQEQIEAAITAAVQATPAYEQRQALFVQGVQNFQWATQPIQSAAASASSASAAAPTQCVDTQLLRRPDSFDGATGWKDLIVVARAKPQHARPSSVSCWSARRGWLRPC